MIAEFEYVIDDEFEAFVTLLVLLPDLSVHCVTYCGLPLLNATVEASLASSQALAPVTGSGVLPLPDELHTPASVIVYVLAESVTS